MQELDEEFWTARYSEGSTGWNIGFPSPPIKDYVDKLTSKDLKILIPGAGNGYEAEYLWEKGYKNIYVLDFSAIPLANFKQRNPDFPDDQLIQMDFFEFKEEFDLVIEQTFFCAIDRSLRKKYAEHMAQIIKGGGTLAGVLFGVEFEKEGPPFGGSKAEYVKYFEPYFEILHLDICKNSLPPRAGNELWMEMVRRNKS